MHTLSISNLSKTYPNGVKALSNVTMEVKSGLFGLLGPNGAGKSSLMRTIATLQNPDTGGITFDGIDILEEPNHLRKLLGYLPQEFGLYPNISAEVLLNHFAVLKGLTHRKQRKERVESLLDQVNLFQHRKKRLGGYSGGMKQRFGIAQALLTNPKLIIVDEPTAGLDPAERNRFHNLLCQVGEEAVVILSTHIVEDVKELCSDMAILNQGKLLFKGSPEQAIELIKNTIYSKQIGRDQMQHYREHYTVISDQLLRGKPIITIQSPTDPGNGFAPVKADLNHVYFSNIFG